MRAIFTLSFLIAVLVACGPKSEIQKIEENYDNSRADLEELDIVQKMDKPDSLLRHVVYFSFKDGTTQDQIKTVVDAFRNLKDEIPGIRSFEWGENSSPEGLNRGLTHAFTLTFNSAEDRDAYLPHPKHKDFGEILGPYLDEVLVVDYWTRP